MPLSYSSDMITVRNILGEIIISESSLRLLLIAHFSGLPLPSVECEVIRTRGSSLEGKRVVTAASTGIIILLRNEDTQDIVIAIGSKDLKELREWLL